MAKIIRFMSSEEFEKYSRGDELYNDDHYIGLSDSVGFCFLPEIIETDYFTLDAEDMENYLEGDYDYMVTFAVKDSSGFKKSTGRYHIRNRIVSIREYSNTSYSKDTLKLVDIKKL